MPVWLRLAGPVVSGAELVRGSDRLDAAIWSSPAPTARPHRRVGRHAAIGRVRDVGARPSGTRSRVASVINIQPYTTCVNPHPISVEIPAAAQIRSYLLRSGSRFTIARQRVPTSRFRSVDRGMAGKGGEGQSDGHLLTGRLCATSGKGRA